MTHDEKLDEENNIIHKEDHIPPEEKRKKHKRRKYDEELDGKVLISISEDQNKSFMFSL